MDTKKFNYTKEGIKEMKAFIGKPFKNVYKERHLGAIGVIEYNNNIGGISKIFEGETIKRVGHNTYEIYTT